MRAPSLCFLSSPPTRRHTSSFEVSPGVISNPLSPHLQVYESVSSIPPFLLPTDQSCHGFSIPIAVVSAQPPPWLIWTKHSGLQTATQLHLPSPARVPHGCMAGVSKAGLPVPAGACSPIHCGPAATEAGADTPLPCAVLRAPTSPGDHRCSRARVLEPDKRGCEPSFVTQFTHIHSFTHSFNKPSSVLGSALSSADPSGNKSTPLPSWGLH